MNKIIENSLNKYILEKGITIFTISKGTKISSEIFYNSFRGKRDLRADELISICSFLEINPMRFIPIKKEIQASNIWIIRKLL